jgi:hypothetical protein
MPKFRTLLPLREQPVQFRPGLVYKGGGKLPGGFLPLSGEILYPKV